MCVSEERKKGPSCEWPLNDRACDRLRIERVLSQSGDSLSLMTSFHLQFLLVHLRIGVPYPDREIISRIPPSVRRLPGLLGFSAAFWAGYQTNVFNHTNFPNKKPPVIWAAKEVFQKQAFARQEVQSFPDVHSVCLSLENLETSFPR